MTVCFEIKHMKPLNNIDYIYFYISIYIITIITYRLTACKSTDGRLTFDFRKNDFISIKLIFAVIHSYVLVFRFVINVVLSWNAPDKRLFLSKPRELANAHPHAHTDRVDSLIQRVGIVR